MTIAAFSFMSAGEIRFGRGASAEAAARAAVLGRRVILVHGARGARADWLGDALRAEGLAVTRFSVPGEPDQARIEAGLTTARAAGADSVVAIGGGAAIDAGKAIAALVPATRPMLDHLEVVGQGLPLDHPPLPFIALPTTAGTGAEVTKNAVIAVLEHHRKVSLRDPRMLPDLAIVDPALTDGCPRAVTLASGLDAVTQVIEPFLSTRANPMTDALCREAIPKGLGALVTLMQGEDPAARDALAWTSLCGGLALANAGLGAVHGLAGPLGGLTGAAHGAICGALLPPVLAANAKACGGGARFEAVARWIATALDTTPESAFDTLAAWSRDAGLPGLDAQEVDAGARHAAAQAAAASSSMKANPAPLSPQTLEAVMDAAR